MLLGTIRESATLLCMDCNNDDSNNINPSSVNYNDNNNSASNSSNPSNFSYNSNIQSTNRINYDNSNISINHSLDQNSSSTGNSHNTK